MEDLRLIIEQMFFCKCSCDCEQKYGAVYADQMCPVQKFRQENIKHIEIMTCLVNENAILSVLTDYQHYWPLLMFQWSIYSGVYTLYILH